MPDSKVSALTTADPKGGLLFYVVDLDEATAANRSKKIMFSSLVDSFVTYQNDFVIYQGNFVHKE